MSFHNKAIDAGSTLARGADSTVDATFPLDATSTGEGTAILNVNPVGSGPDGATEVAITAPLGPQAAAASVATVISGTTANGYTNSAGSNISPAGSVTIPPGAVSIEFILFPSAVGVVNGITFDNTTSDVILVYRLDAAYWRPLDAVTYELTAGTGALTVQT